MKFLTKTLFKKGLECPIKLSVDYESSEDKNEFLDALADGGFQAEELSRLYYSPGVLIEDYDYATSLQKTRDLIKKPKSIIYEAAFLHENLFIRTDILVKTDNVRTMPRGPNNSNTPLSIDLKDRVWFPISSVWKLNVLDLIKVSIELVSFLILTIYFCFSFRVL